MKALLSSSVSFGAMSQRRMDGSFALPLMEFMPDEEESLTRKPAKADIDSLAKFAGDILRG